MNQSDWANLLDRHGIAYATSGKNVGSGNIAINCPFCGDDPSHHLNIQPNTGWYFCFRNDQHKGRNPFFLVKELVGIAEARLFCHSEGDKGADDLSALLATLDGKKEALPPRKPLVLPGREYDPHTDQPFLKYLLSRGIPEEDVSDFVRENKLRICAEGAYEGRWIIPYLSMDGKNVLTFTGRAIYKTMDLRYKSPSNAEGTPPNQVVWLNASLNCDILNTLVLVEGPWDKLMASFYDQRWFGALSTNRVSDPQINQLLSLKREGGLKEIVLLLDKDQPDSRLLVQMGLQDKLGIPVKLASLRGKWKDAGEVPVRELLKRNWFKLE